MKFAPFSMLLVVPVKAPAVSGETVCGASLILTHSTCVPTLILRVAGSKVYFSSFSTIFTMTVAPGVGLGVAVGVGGAVVEVGFAAVVRPQATKRRLATAVNDRTSHRNLRRLEPECE